MFKISNDVDSDDDLLENEFTDNLLSSTVAHKESSSVGSTPNNHCAGNSKSFITKSPIFYPSPAEPPKTSCSYNDITPSSSTCIPNGVKPSIPISRGFQPKTKTSPILLNPAATSSTHFKKKSSGEPLIHLSSDNSRLNLCGIDGPILHKDNYTNSFEVYHSKKASISSHASPISSGASTNIEKRNSAFLAEWNGDNIFNAPPEKQPDPSLAIRTHTPDVVTRKVNRAVRQRRFPGPAGLLPPRQGDNTSLIAPEEFLNELKNEDNDPTYQATEILSQSSGSVFDGGAWSAMLDDLGASAHSLLKSMNLSSVKTIGRNVRSYKIPFLSVLVQSIDGSLPDAAVVFKDPTGEMHGVIHRDVWDQFSSDIAVGTVLVLRNVGIISAGVSSRKQVVNITGNNLTAIYSPKDELNVQLRRIHEFATIASSKLIAEWEKVQTASSSSPVSRRVQMEPRRSPLFNGFQADAGYPGSIGGTSGSRPPNQLRVPSGVPIPVAPNFNQRSRPVVPSLIHRDETSTSSSNTRDIPIERGLNNSTAPMDRILNPSKAPNACLNSGAKASSSFSPMPSNLSTNQRFPVNANKENSDSVRNNKFAQKSPFTLKAAAGIRPSPQHPSRFSQSQISTLTPTAPPTSPSSPTKKPKISHNVAFSATTSKTNPFQVDENTSEIDSLLEGIDTDSLFDDF